jgi:hypothetical protein
MKLGNLQDRWRPGHQNTMTAREQQQMDPTKKEFHNVPAEMGLQMTATGSSKPCARCGNWSCAGCATKSVRQFGTGATRDADDGKNDYEGFLSPVVIEAYGDYMHEHRKQSDGQLRDSDNWQKGMPKSQYMKSLLRHVLTAWKLHRGWEVKPEKIGGVLRVPTMKETLCAILFNTMGYLHEMLKEDLAKTEAA